MATTKTETNIQTSSTAKSVAWMVESAFRAFAGWTLLTYHMHNYITAVAGIYALLTAFVIVVAHFVKAHK